MDYRVGTLHPPEWSVHKLPGMHLSTMEGAPVDEWHAVPDVTSDELLRQLTHLAKGTSQACSYQSQESYFRHSPWFKEAIHDYKAEQGHQYRDSPVHEGSEIVGSIIATVTHLQQELQESKNGQQAVNDCTYDASVQRCQRRSETLRTRLPSSNKTCLELSRAFSRLRGPPRSTRNNTARLL